MQMSDSSERPRSPGNSPHCPSKQNSVICPLFCLTSSLPFTSGWDSSSQLQALLLFSGQGLMEAPQATDAQNSPSAENSLLEPWAAPLQEVCPALCRDWGSADKIRTLGPGERRLASQHSSPQPVLSMVGSKTTWASDTGHTCILALCQGPSR